MTTLDNKMDELLACEGVNMEEVVDTGAIIEQLVEYYNNVAVTLKEFQDKYNRIQRKALQKNRVGNSD
jgi:hypothetical protein